ncbi:MAG: polysaccharide biosynthesis/export family protein, partial [Aquaticitalea sp.]
MQDIDDYNNTALNQSYSNIQPNDILKITVGALVEESAIPYNRPVNRQSTGPGNSDAIKLEGYVVTQASTITFPVLGTISTANLTVLQLQDEITNMLESGGHLKHPTVSVRVLNSKITILGEVNSPGTIGFPENSITLLQALGYAGD